MSGILLILQFILAILITIIVLLQKSSSIGLGAYSGSNESLFGAKGPAGVLAKLTFGLGFIFVINTIALGFLYMQDAKKSIVDNIRIDVPAAPTTPNAPTAAPSAPEAPAPVAPTNTESN